MEKKIICILVSMLMCATVFSVAGTKNISVANEYVSSNVTENSFSSYFEDWVHYDDGTCENALGLTAGGVLHVVIKLTPTELGAYTNHWFTNLKVMHGWPTGTPQPANDYTVWMFTGANHPTDPMTEATIVATGTSPATNDWVEVDVDNYEFLPTDTVWVGVAWTHAAGNFPAGFDTGTNVPGKSGWLLYGTTWTELSAIGYPGSWNLWVQVETKNQAPNTPGAPDGPDQGITEVPYTFTATTTDPEGDPIEYWFEWGDGENSGWVSPGSAQHAWTTEGNFEVTVKARDATNGGESAFSPAHIIEILSGPLIKIENIKGGIMRVTARINNSGAIAATDVQWTITLEGGAFTGKITNGVADSIAAGEYAIIKSKPIIGFGKTKVTITAEIPDMTDTEVRNGNVYLFYVKVNPGGG
jgi:hypothetical protein